MTDEPSRADDPPPADDLRTSGDLAADRRYAWAVAALGEGDAVGAADLLRQALERAPAWPPAWLALGDACRHAGDTAEAAAAWRRCLALDPADRLGAGPRLAEAGEAPAVGAISPAYVARLFDDYAPRFEQHLVQSLGYRGPALVSEALAGAAPGRRFARVLDLGCGTGLMGDALRPLAGWLGGCDLSAAMLERARARSVYDSLARCDLLAALAAEEPGALDLAVAADVLIYVPDLAPVFAAAARALPPGGLFAFTTQDVAGEGPDVAVGADLRVRHAGAHVILLAREAGFDVAARASRWARRERGEPVPGLVAVLRR
jgi:predicted TPR repeat methyltransferase